MVEAFVDREMRALSAGAQLTLWCGRVWVRHLYAGEPATPCLRRGLEVTGAADGLEEICAVLELIGAAGEGRLSFGGCRCRPVTPDESRLLGTIQASQRGGRDAAVTLFGAWMPPVAARDAAVHAGRFAACLADADLPVAVIDERGSAPRRLH